LTKYLPKMYLKTGFIQIRPDGIGLGVFWRERP
jgi:hypothetical protein